MRKIILGLTALATLVLGLVFGSAPAQAASYVGVTSAPGTHHSSGCWEHPYSVTMNLGPEVYHWDLDLNVYGPDGTITDMEYEYGYTTQTGYAVTANLNAFLCGSLDDPGTYTVTGVLETATRSWTDLPDVPVSGTFTSTFPASAPAQQQVTPKGKVQATVSKQSIRLVMSTGSVPSGTRANTVTWSILVDGHKVSTQRQQANDRVTWSKHFAAHSGQHRVTVLKNGKTFRTYRVTTG